MFHVRSIYQLLIQPPPKDEDEMMQNVYDVVDRLFRIARPRKVLYLAVGTYNY